MNTGSLCRRPFGSRSRVSVKVVVAPRPSRNPKDLSQMDPARRVCRWRAPAASGGLGRATSTTCAAFLADRLAIGETERFSIHRKCSRFKFSSHHPPHNLLARCAGVEPSGSAPVSCAASFEELCIHEKNHSGGDGRARIGRRRFSRASRHRSDRHAGLRRGPRHRLHLRLDQACKLQFRPRLFGNTQRVLIRA